MNMNTQSFDTNTTRLSSKGPASWLVIFSLVFALASPTHSQNKTSDTRSNPPATDVEKLEDKAPDTTAPGTESTSLSPPANDNFANAFSFFINGAGSGITSNVEATSEPGEPIHGAGRGSNTNNSIWYKHVANANGVVNFKTLASPTDPIADTVLSAYRGTSLNTLVPVAANDDYVGTFYSAITFTVTAGHTYYVAIDGFGTRMGGLIYSYSAYPSPPNNNIAGAVDLMNLQRSPFIGITGSNMGATGESGEPMHHSSGAAPLNSIWYKWTPPAPGSYTFTTEGSNFDTILAVYKEVGGTPQGLVASSDDFGVGLASRVTFYSPGGESYLIAIEGYGLGTGDSLLNWYPYRAESGKKFDFDGDTKSDMSIFRGGSGQWWIKRSSSNTAFVASFGTSTDQLTPADYTGDGKVDIAFWRPSNGYWYVLRSENFTFYAFPFGTAGDIPAAGNFDVDPSADHAIFRPSTGVWYVNTSRDGVLIRQWGGNGDKPVVADYDGDGMSDYAIFRPSTGEWWIDRSREGVVVSQFGTASDIPVPGSYDGDGRANIAFWRPSNGHWFVLSTPGGGSYYAFPFGISTDIPAPGDYDGDGRMDPGVFRPSNGTWYIDRTGPFGVLIEQFGANGDRPVPSSYLF
jgi:hypothetical protein